MRIILALSLMAAILVACGGGDGSESLPTAVARVVTATPEPLSLGQDAQIADGLTMAVLWLAKSKCDSGQGLLIAVRWTNRTNQFIRGYPALVVISPDNQRLVQYIGIYSGEGMPDYLPQGFPPNATSLGYICVATGGQPFTSTYVGTLPGSFPGWLIESQQGPKWQVRP